MDFEEFCYKFDLGVELFTYKLEKCNKKLTLSVNFLLPKYIYLLSEVDSAKIFLSKLKSHMPISQH